MAAAQSTGLSVQTYVTNTLMGCAEAIEASDLEVESRRQRLLLLLLYGSSWESISKVMGLPVDCLRRAGAIMATEIFRGDRHV